MRFIALLALVALTSCGVSDPAADSYHAGDYGQAWKAYRDLGQRAGESESTRLKNLAYAAMAAGRMDEAEIALEKLAARDGVKGQKYRDFFAGNLAFASCLRAERVAERVEAGPVAFDAAMLFAEEAIAAWRQSLLAKAWPDKALRNLERALIAIDRLRIKREAAATKKNKRNNPRELPNQPQSGRQQPQFEERRVEAQIGELTPTELSSLMKRLEQKQSEKKRSRRKAKNRAAASAQGGRGW
ncbi:MAG: hypothetical protein V3W41_11845 [Planctomycetota bacterium]